MIESDALAAVIFVVHLILASIFLMWCGNRIEKITDKNNWKK